MPEALPSAARTNRVGSPAAAGTSLVPLGGIKARLVQETRVLHRRAWRNLTVQIHEEPSRQEPTMVDAVPETQISLQLSGALHLRFDKDGHRFSYQNAPGSVCLVAAHGPDYEVAWLRRTRWTVAHVASAVGYRSVRHFTLLFRRRMGCPPAEYARRRSG